ncbi:MAG: exodeoxyribonuclease VII small subunit [Ignavibacteria bacterium]|nr:exodeoxyribonuclease VII small subunit [Ignavibacteria bacterium]
MAKSKEDTTSFEYSFKKLQSIMESLDDSTEETSLDELIKNYQEGLQLIKSCRDKLNEAELKIEKINSENSK